MNDDATRIKHILDCVKRIQEWTVNGREAFLEDEMMQSAVVHELEVIGEATKALTRDYRDAHPQIPWKGMAGLRDILIHEYDIIDVDEVWHVVERDVLTLKRGLSPKAP
jgi:uncharacterized protein with HEPN domain